MRVTGSSDRKMNDAEYNARLDVGLTFAFDGIGAWGFQPADETKHVYSAAVISKDKTLLWQLGARNMRLKAFHEVGFI